MANYSSVSDSQLISLFKAGDEAAFAEIYNRYADSLIGFAASKLFYLEDCHDIIQDLFVSIWEKREITDISKNLKAYLFTAVRYRMIDHIRKNITKSAYANIVQQLAAAYQPTALQDIEADETKAIVTRALNTLSPRVKEIYLLSREEQLSHAEIAKKMNISEQTVRNQLSTALRHLRQHLSPSVFIFLYWWFR